MDMFKDEANSDSKTSRRVQIPFSKTFRQRMFLGMGLCGFGAAYSLSMFARYGESLYFYWGYHIFPVFWAHTFTAVYFPIAFIVCLPAMWKPAIDLQHRGFSIGIFGKNTPWERLMGIASDERSIFVSLKPDKRSIVARILGFDVSRKTQEIKIQNYWGITPSEIQETIVMYASEKLNKSIPILDARSQRFTINFKFGVVGAILVGLFPFQMIWFSATLPDPISRANGQIEEALSQYNLGDQNGAYRTLEALAQEFEIVKQGPDFRTSPQIVRRARCELYRFNASRYPEFANYCVRQL